MKTLSNAVRRTGAVTFGLVVLFAGLWGTGNLRAEGSKELCANGGDRPWLMYRNDLTDNSPITNLTIVSAYANVGETINLGSSVATTSKIIWYAPNGVIGTNNSAGGVGVISNRTQEVAGPLPNAGGYNPRTITVTNGQAGVWQIHFVSPDPTSTANPTAVIATNAWTQPATGGQVAAWDVTVRNSGGTNIPGRVYANLLSLNVGEWLSGGAIRYQVYCLTSDGYQYRINLNSLDPFRFQFFANNRGFRDGTGAPLFKSVDLAASSVKDPLSPDTATDITHKLFFNVPAGDLPTNAATRSGTTWLLNPPKTAVTTSGMQFIGLDGTTNQVGSALGGYFTFNANGPGSYLINIDLDNDGMYTSAVDRVLLGTAVQGNNSVFWDGKDGLGNPAPRSVSGFSSAVAVANGEVHFPFADAEGCYNGIVIQRLNGPVTNSYTVFWDDSNFTGGTKSLPPNGSNSIAGAHSWLPSGTSGFGNQRGIDTWVFVPGNYTQPPSPIVIKQTDLELVSQTRTPTFVDPNSSITYTVVIRNNGPDNTPQARFLDYYPPGLTNFHLVSGVFSGTAGITSSVFSNGAYDAQIHMNASEVGTLTFNGTVSAGLGSILTNLTQFLTYNDIGDVNDPDRVGAGNNGNTNVIAVTFSVSGYAYNDANLNATRDGGENGTGLGSLYAKLINTNSPATAVQAALVDPTTGAYTLSTTVTGGYTVILDDNNTLSDVTPALPAGWLGTEAIDQRRTGITVLNDVNNINFGLYNGSYLLLNSLGSPTVRTSAGSITMSVTVTNTSSISNALTSIIDNLPNVPGAATYVAGSSTYNGTAIGNPTIVSVTNLTWSGTFSVPGNRTGTLVFAINIPATLGVYTNRTFGLVSNTQIDTTTNTADNAPAIETIRMSAVANNPPVVSNVTASVNAGSNVTLDPKATDPDNDPLTLFIVTAPAHGSVAINGNLTFTYTPLFSYHGADSFTYRATDGTSNSVLGTASITVFDVTPPTITTCATNLTGSANGSCQASVPDFTASAVASDNSGVAPTITQSPVLGTLVGIGTTTVTIRAVDGSANTNTCTASFIVGDTTAPTITTCATNITGFANGTCQAAVPNFTNAVVASDCSPFSITQSPTIGTLVGTGTNAVTIRVVDSNANTNTCSVSFIVRDTTPPTITQCATNISASANGSCQAVVPNFTNAVVATDNCGGAVAITQVPAIGTLAGIGTNTVTIRVIDISANTNTCTASFIVRDTTAPTITTCATNISASANTNCQAAVPNFTNAVVAADNCSAVTLSQSPAIGALVGIGSNTVTISAFDTSGNTNTCTALFIVRDTTPPTITTVATNITASANANCQAAVPNFTNAVVAADNCSAVTLSQSPAIGTLVGTGSNTVTISAFDTSGNTNTCTALFIVRDGTPPTINTCATNITVSANASCQAAVPNFTNAVVATDNCGSAFSITQTPVIGALVGVGTNTVTIRAFDVSGNTNTCTASLIVLDTTPPSITTCATNLTASAGGGGTANVPSFTNSVVASDNCGSVTLTQSPVIGTPQGIGPHTITITATDNAGNTNSCTATFTVNDTTPPQITTCAGNQTAEAGANCQAVVPSFTNGGVATDNSGVTPTITQSPLAGALANYGTNNILIIATDGASNSSTCAAKFVVLDTTAPNISVCPAPVTVNTDAGTNFASNVNLGAAPTASDACGISSISSNAPAHFPVGSNTVTWTVTDIHSNSATCLQTVVVIDNQPPLITCPGNVVTNLPAGQCSLTNVVLGTPGVSDNVGVASVVSNAPALFNIGTTQVVWTATDTSGNTAVCTQNVTVVDVTPPQITQLPGNQSAEAVANCQAAVPNFTGGLITLDACGTNSVTQVPAAGTLANLGTNTISLIVADQSGNTTTGTVTFTVVDTTPPLISQCAPGQQAFAGNNGTANLPNFTTGVVASDNCGNGFNVTQSPLAGSPAGIGSNTVTLTVTDASGNSSTCTATFVVIDNTPPVITHCAGDQSAEAGAGCQAIVPNFTGGVTATDNSGVAPTITQSPLAGTQANFGTNTVTLTATDGSGNSAQCTAHFIVTDTTAPSITCPANIILIAAAGSNSVDNITLATPGTSDNCGVASVTNNAPGSYPIGVTTVTWTVTDVHGNMATCQQTVTVKAVNHAPVAVADVYTNSQNSALVVSAPGVLANDSDPDGDPIFAVIVSTPTNGLVTLNADGSFTYTPNAGFVGTDSFLYKVSDGNLSSGNAIITLVVEPVNQPAVVNPDSYSTPVNTTLNVSAPGVLANDYDPEGSNLTAVVVSNPTHGSLTLNPNGSFQYIPDNGYIGFDQFSYAATDGATNSEPVLVTLAVGLGNAPVANPDSYTLNENASLHINATSGVLSNDTGSGPLTAFVVSGPYHGTLAFNPNGSFTYTPDANFSGTDTFTYRATDGTLVSSAATVTLHVTHVHQPPVANPDSYSVTTNGTLIVNAASGVLANDCDPEGLALTALLVNNVAHGTLTLHPDGSFTYSPNNGFTGADNFMYEATDSATTSTPVTVTIHVDANNHVPVANNDSYDVDENGALNVPAHGVLANDYDADGNTLTPSVVTQPAHGALTLNADGSFTYTPTNGFSGADVFSYKVNDGTVDSSVAKVFISVNHVVLPPTVQDSTPTVGSSETLVLPAPGALTGSTSPSGLPLTSLLVTNVAHGTLALNGDGSYSYTPDANFLGVDCYVFAATDGVSTSGYGHVCITVVDTTPPAITSCASNRNVSADNGCHASLPNLTGDVSATDNSGVAPTITQSPTAGTTIGHGSNTVTLVATDGSGNSSTCTATVVVLDTTPPVITLAGLSSMNIECHAGFSDPGATASDNCAGTLTGSIVVTGLVNANAVGTYTLHYNVTDPSGNAATEVTRTVHVVDTTPPSLACPANVMVTVPQGSNSVSGVNLGTPSASDNCGEVHVTNNAPGSFPIGNTTVTWTADDGNGNTNICQQTVTVLPGNHPPVANDGTFTMTESGTLQIPAPGVIAFASDQDNDPLTAIKMSNPAHGTLTFNTDGSFTYTAIGGFHGIDSFTYAVSDGFYQSNTAMIFIVSTSDQGATDVDLYARRATFGITWSAPNRDRFTISGKINPRGSKADLAGATLAITVNGTNLFPAITLDPTGHGTAQNGSSKVKVFLSSLTGTYAVGVSGIDLRTLLGVPNTTGVGAVPINVQLIITFADLEVTPIRGIFETPYKTTAGKVSKGAFTFAKNRTLTGVFNVNKTIAGQLKNGQFKVSGAGVIENAGGSNVQPTGPVRLTIGGDVLTLPNNTVKASLIGTKRIFKFKAPSLANTGIPAAGPGAPTVAHLPIILEVPTASGTNVFNSIIELKRADGTSTKWMR